jgi:hypothetical protein
VASDFCTIDCETWGFKAGRLPVPLLWGFYDGQNYVEFESTREFAEFLSHKNVTAYAHNGGKFDFHFLAEWFSEGVPIHVINGRLVKLKLGACELRDSYSIIPRPLRDYKKDDFDYSVLEPETWRQHRAYISRYLESDCVYLHELISRQREAYGKSLTLAGSAMKVWLKGFNGPKENQPKWLYDTIGPFYHGGRVESFFKGEYNKPFVSHDINSAYPRAMMEAHPQGGGFTITRAVTKGALGGSYFVKCTGISQGAFPYREKAGLSFPSDDLPRTYFVTGWEWLTAQELGLFKGKVDLVYNFTGSVTFTPYVNHFFTEKAACKEKGDKAGELLAKLYLNSLYGKFGANPEKYREYMLGPSMPEGDGWELSGELGGHILWDRALPEHKQRYFNVATAASITGWVRAYLLRHIKSATAVLYCDTDCIVSETFSGKVGKALGEWSKEGDYTCGAFAGKKLYALQKSDGSFKIASKGVKITEKDIFALARGKIVEHKKDAPSYSVNGEARFTTRKIKMT